jgi:hypothetical protein
MAWSDSLPPVAKSMPAFQIGVAVSRSIMRVMNGNSLHASIERFYQMTRTACGRLSDIRT